MLTLCGMYLSNCPLHALDRQSRKQFEVAKVAYAEALDIFIVLYGDIHPAVARTMNNLATLMDDSGSTSEVLLSCPLWCIGSLAGPATDPPT
jgi:hypothetical protein